MTATLVIGTHNRKKGLEIVQILETSGLRLLTLDEFPDAPEPVEDADTLEGNAIKKATELADALGRMVAADDSGLEVDALGGEPGVFSARYGGEHGNDSRNIERLLREMKDVPPEKRTARFRTVVAVAVPGELLGTVEGALEGAIALEPRGSNGFGYDPVFIVPGLGATCAELAPDEKNSISHRGQAFRKLNDELPRLLQSAAGKGQA
jgi:XTP/dITP diphosphohydrolase